MEAIRPTKMLRAVDVMDDLGVSRPQLQTLRELGILKPIYIGSGWKYSQQDVIRFQDEYAGLDVSNPQKALEAKKTVEERKAKQNESIS